MRFRTLFIAAVCAGLALGSTGTSRGATYFSVDYLSLTLPAYALPNLNLPPMATTQGLTLLPFYFHVHVPTNNANWGLDLYSDNRRVLGNVSPPNGIYRGLRETTAAALNIPLYWQVYPDDQNVSASWGTPGSVTLTTGGLGLTDLTLPRYWGTVYDQSDLDKSASWVNDRPERTIASATGLGNYPTGNRLPPREDAYLYFGGDLRNTTSGAAIANYVGELTLDFFVYPFDLNTGCFVTPNPVKPVLGQRAYFNFFTPDPNTPVTIKIYDPTGYPVATLQNTRYWDCRNDRGHLVEGGLYLYQIKTQGRIISGTVVVIK